MSDRPFLLVSFGFLRGIMQGMSLNTPYMIPKVIVEQNGYLRPKRQLSTSQSLIQYSETVDLRHNYGHLGVIQGALVHFWEGNDFSKRRTSHRCWSIYIYIAVKGFMRYSNVIHQKTTVRTLDRFKFEECYSKQNYSTTDWANQNFSCLLHTSECRVKTNFTSKCKYTSHNHAHLRWRFWKYYL